MIEVKEGDMATNDPQTLKQVTREREKKERGIEIYLDCCFTSIYYNCRYLKSYLLIISGDSEASTRAGQCQIRGRN